MIVMMMVIDNDNDNDDGDVVVNDDGTDDGNDMVRTITGRENSAQSLIFISSIYPFIHISYLSIHISYLSIHISYPSIPPSTHHLYSEHVTVEYSVLHAALRARYSGYAGVLEHTSKKKMMI